MSTPKTISMRTLRFHGYGEPADVLVLEEAPIPSPAPGRIRIKVKACGLNPADWALCRGLFAGQLPRGIGLDVSGIIETLGEGVSGVKIGDSVLGAADWAGCTSAGASDYAIMDHWTVVPEGLDMIEAASLTMVVETAYRSLDNLGVIDKTTVLIHAAGTMVGFSAVQMARMRGARVIATAGETFAARLRALGATVTPYGEGMAERVREIAGGSPDLILDTAPPSGVLPELVKIAGGDPKRVLTITDFTSAKELGVRDSFGESAKLRFDVLSQFAQLAAEKRFTVPIARTFSLEKWRDALEISLQGKAQGKLVLLPGTTAKKN